MNAVRYVDLDRTAAGLKTPTSKAEAEEAAIREGAAVQGQ